MKHPIAAAVTLALGVSMGAAAYAQAPQAPMHPSGTMPPGAAGSMQHSRTAMPGSMHARTNRPISGKEMARQAQQTLKSEGFYKGKIDGKWGPGSRQALNQFERRHKLPATGGRLNHASFSALMGSTVAGTGTGSRHPAGGPPPMTGSSQAMPAPTQAPGAGTSTPPAEPNAQR